MEDLVVGHLQMDRVYPSTWCIHHLAIDPKISKVVARDIYAVMTDVLHAEKANYVLSFTEAAKPWNQRTYYDFVKSYRYPEHNELKSFQIYNARTDASSKIARDSTIGLRQASQYDLRRISRFFELYSSPLERNACALTYEDLELQGIQDELKAVDLERQRAFVVAYQGTHMVGFARVETATPGVNIVGVFDMLYVHILPEFTGRDLSIRQTLIAGGLEKFRQLGKHEVLLALDDEYRENHEASGLKFVTDAVRWIALRDCVSRYYGFTQMLYGHLIFRRELIHKKRPNK